MANLTLSDVHIVRTSEMAQMEGLSAVALSAGWIVRLDANGNFVRALGNNAGNAGTVRWIVVDARAAKKAVTGFRAGALIYLGKEALDAVAPGAPLYLADDGGITPTIGESTTATLLGWCYSVPVTRGSDKLLQMA